MLGRIRRWIARVVALAITVLALGRVTVQWRGVQPSGADSRERPAISAPQDEPPSP